MRFSRALMVVPIAFALVACGDDDGGGGGGGGDLAFCDGVADIEERFAELEEFDPFGDEDPAAMFSELSDEIDNLDRPDEIADDIDLLVDALRSSADVMEDFDFSDPETFDEEAFTEEFAEIEDEFAGVEAAGDRIEAYAEEECGISLDGDDDSDSTEENSGE